MSKFLTFLTIVLLLIPAMLFSTERLPRPEKITLSNRWLFIICKIQSYLW